MTGRIKIPPRWCQHKDILYGFLSLEEAEKIVRAELSDDHVVTIHAYYGKEKRAGRTRTIAAAVSVKYHEKLQSNRRRHQESGADDPGQRPKPGQETAVDAAEAAAPDKTGWVRRKGSAFVNTSKDHLNSDSFGVPQGEAADAQPSPVADQPPKNPEHPNPNNVAESTFGWTVLEQQENELRRKKMQQPVKPEPKKAAPAAKQPPASRESRSIVPKNNGTAGRTAKEILEEKMAEESRAREAANLKTPDPRPKAEKPQVQPEPPRPVRQKSPARAVIGAKWVKKNAPPAPVDAPAPEKPKQKSKTRWVKKNTPDDLQNAAGNNADTQGPTQFFDDQEIDVQQVDAALPIKKAVEKPLPAVEKPPKQRQQAEVKIAPKNVDRKTPPAKPEKEKPEVPPKASPPEPSRWNRAALDESAPSDKASGTSRFFDLDEPLAPENENDAEHVVDDLDLDEETRFFEFADEIFPEDPEPDDQGDDIYDGFDSADGDDERSMESLDTAFDGILSFDRPLQEKRRSEDRQNPDEPGNGRARKQNRDFSDSFEEHLLPADAIDADFEEPEPPARSTDRPGRTERPAGKRPAPPRQNTRATIERTTTSSGNTVISIKADPSLTPDTTLQRIAHAQAEADAMNDGGKGSAASELAEIVRSKLKGDSLKDLNKIIPYEEGRRFVRHIFKSREKQYRDFLNLLNYTANWQLASDLIYRYFDEKGVDPYCREALEFSNRVYLRYFPHDIAVFKGERLKFG